MDTTEQKHLAMAKDPATASRIVQNIAAIEQDFRLAEGYLSDWMLREIIAALRTTVPAPFEVVTTAWAAIISCPDWKPNKRPGRGDAWLDIVEHAEDEDDHTWLAAALGAGPTALHLELIFREGLSHYMDKLAADTSLMAKLRKKGFKVELTAKRVYLPLVIDAALFAKAVAENDFDAAMAPAREAAELGVAAKPEIDDLLKQVRG
ncbi:hypothetical protein GRI62_11530 [Erythrobacter arachoides]|uniref:Uncharacterized protein n=1 Tax=Aurantiacibacter arachoides TaxID=1850444 RepID=A0A845A4Z2_9SPHN|nr:hypothetical protein [Aurantiacibacter arachoides]MXO94226.1 hypothetical protein [Aurantiacibacter arachoides]GGD65139.1 hypothetical protein GCM10011411_26810 [Aurantiacibacter arachoides]